MMEDFQALHYHAVLKQLGRPVVYYPRIAEAFGKDIRCAAFLGNFTYWEGKQSDPDGWTYKSQAEIERETGLGRYAQEKAREKLRELGVLQERKDGKPPILKYKFDWGKMDDVLNKYFAGEKAEKITIEKQDPLLYRMKLAFDDAYQLATNGLTFEWGDKETKGMHWKGLSGLKDCVKNRLVDIYKKRSIVKEITEDDILNSFVGFLSMLPEDIKLKFFEPMKIYRMWNSILPQMVKNGDRNSQNGTAATPDDYVTK